MASPSAVPPRAWRLAIPAWRAARSVVAATTTRGAVEKATSPTLTPAGSWSMKSLAACWAAASRVGETSVAIIDPETSIVEDDRGLLARDLDGHRRPGQGEDEGGHRNEVQGRRHVAPPGRRPGHEVAEQVDVREPDRVATAPALDEAVDDQRGRHEEQAEEQERIGEGHDRSPRTWSSPARARSQSPAVERTMWSTPIRRRVGRHGRPLGGGGLGELLPEPPLTTCRPGPRGPSRRRRGSARRRRSARTRAGRRPRRRGRGGGRPARQAVGASCVGRGSRTRGRPGRRVARPRWPGAGHRPATSRRPPPRPFRPGWRAAGRAARPGPRPVAGAGRASRRT